MHPPQICRVEPGAAVPQSPLRHRFASSLLFNTQTKGGMTQSTVTRNNAFRQGSQNARGPDNQTTTHLARVEASKPGLAARALGPRKHEQRALYRATTNTSRAARYNDNN